MTTATKPTNGHAPAVRDQGVGALEAAVVHGDLGRLTEPQRLAYYRMRCEAAGVDPRACPFSYIVLQGKLVLYATRAMTDQLIATRKLGVEVVDRRYDAQLGIYEVRARVKFPDGHTVENLAAVSLAGLKGEVLCNGVMKAITKAIRRTVLSACGLGALDETEVETIRDATPPAGEVPTPIAAELPVPGQPPDFLDKLQAVIDDFENEWKMTCALARVDYQPLGAKGKRITPWQVCNGLAKRWIDAKILARDEVYTAGKWDQRKAYRVVLNDLSDSDPTEFWAEVRGYLQAKVDAATSAAGINLDAEPEAGPDDAQPTA